MPTPAGQLTNVWLPRDAAPPKRVRFQFTCIFPLPPPHTRTSTYVHGVFVIQFLYFS